MGSNLLIITIKPRSALLHVFHVILLTLPSSLIPFPASFRPRGQSSKPICDLLMIAQLVSSRISKAKERSLVCVAQPCHLPSVALASLSPPCPAVIGAQALPLSPQAVWLACFIRPLPASQNTAERLVSTCELKEAFQQQGLKYHQAFLRLLSENQGGTWHVKSELIDSYWQ